MSLKDDARKVSKKYIKPDERVDWSKAHPLPPPIIPPPIERETGKEINRSPIP